jgi:hypothetical protein
MKYYSMIFALMCALLAGAAAPAVNQAIPASLIQLIANPEKYDGKLVTVQGFLKLGEHPALWVHDEDFKNVLWSNSIWVEPSAQMVREGEAIEFMYVDLEGVFRAGHQGHLYFLSGGIGQIRSCTAWSNPRRPRSLRAENEIPEGKDK